MSKNTRPANRETTKDGGLTAAEEAIVQSLLEDHPELTREQAIEELRAAGM